MGVEQVAPASAARRGERAGRFAFAIVVPVLVALVFFRGERPRGRSSGRGVALGAGARLRGAPPQGGAERSSRPAPRRSAFFLRANVAAPRPRPSARHAGLVGSPSGWCFSRGRARDERCVNPPGRGRRGRGPSPRPRASRIASEWDIARTRRDRWFDRPLPAGRSGSCPLARPRGRGDRRGAREGPRPPVFLASRASPDDTPRHRARLARGHGRREGRLDRPADCCRWPNSVSPKRRLTKTTRQAHPERRGEET